MSERSRQPVEEGRTEEAPAPPETSPEPTPGGEKEREQPSALDMLFREAEVIAQNLKESGTRR